MGDFKRLWGRYGHADIFTSVANIVIESSEIKFFLLSEGRGNATEDSKEVGIWVFKTQDCQKGSKTFGIGDGGVGSVLDTYTEYNCLDVWVSFLKLAYDILKMADLTDFVGSGDAIGTSKPEQVEVSEDEVGPCGWRRR